MAATRKTSSGEYGPSPLYTVFSTYVFLNALWEYELARTREIYAEEHVRPTSWKDIIVLEASHPVHLEPLSETPMDKLFDELAVARFGAFAPRSSRAASQAQDDDSSD